MVLAVQSCESASPCHNPTFKFVPQTISGTGKMIEHIGEMHVNNVTVPAQDIEATMTIRKFAVDYEKMSSRQEMMMDMKMANNQTLQMEINQIMNWEARTLTMFTKNDVTGGRCQTIKLPDMLPPARLVNFILDRLMSMCKCVGRDGDFDKYVFGFDFPPAWLPIPVKESVNMHITCEVADNGMIKSESVNERVKTLQMDVDIDFTMAFTDGSLGGPSALDLVPPASWGCETVNSGREFFEEWSRYAVGRNRFIPEVIKTADSNSMWNLVV